MPKNPVTDLITDQEIAFAHLILAGTMTDRRAAEAVGLNPDAAADTKAEPRITTYLREHRATTHQQRVQQESEQLQRQCSRREQVLARLWEIANLSPEATRNSVTAQVKALSMIIAIEGLIPDRRATAAEKKADAPPAAAPFYKAKWLREQEGETTSPDPDFIGEAGEPAVPPPGAASDAPPAPTQHVAAQPSIPAATTHWTPDAVNSPGMPDQRVPFSIKMGRFGRR